MFTKRQKNIINFLNSLDKSATSSEISSKLGYSSRTIKSEIKEINHLSENFSIESLGNRGYKISYIDQILMEQELKISESAQNFNYPENRINYLIVKLLSTTGSVEKYQLIEELGISESTLNNDIFEVKKILLLEEIELSNKKGYYSVHGTESVIRAAIKKYIDIDFSTISLYNSTLFTLQIGEEDIDFLSRVVIDGLKANGVEILGTKVTNIIIHIIISLYRIKNGSTIKSISNEKETGVYGIISAGICLEIAKYFNVNINEMEQEYLSHCLKGKGIRDTNSNLLNDCVDNSFEIINELYDDILLELPNSKESLYFHVNTMMERIEKGILVDESIVEYVKMNFVLAYEFAMILKHILEERMHISIDENESAYLAIHFGAMLEELQNTPTKVVLVTEAPIGNVLLLKKHIQKHFKDELVLMCTVSPYEMENLKYVHYDFILSTEYMQEENCLYIPMFLETKDLNRIKKAINSKRLIDNFFRKDLFHIEGENTTMESIIERIECVSKKKGLIKKEVDLKALIEERELIQSTKFNKHVVLPHSIQPIHEECFIYTVICKKPVHWHGDAEARLIMYIGINKKDKYKINDIFRVISNIVSNNDLTERLLDSTDYESFVSIIRNHI